MTEKFYPIEDIEGIGATYGEKLRAAGVDDTGALLEKAASRKGREALAAETGVSEKLILTWVNHADMMRISGIGPQYAELLENAGVDTLKELRTRNAENLAEKMAATNAARKVKVTGHVPGASTIQRWIDDAQGMEPRITH